MTYLLKSEVDQQQLKTEVEFLRSKYEELQVHLMERPSSSMSGGIASTLFRSPPPPYSSSMSMKPPSGHSHHNPNSNPYTTPTVSMKLPTQSPYYPTPQNGAHFIQAPVKAIRAEYHHQQDEEEEEESEEEEEGEETDDQESITRRFESQFVSSTPTMDQQQQRQLLLLQQQSSTPIASRIIQEMMNNHSSSSPPPPAPPLPGTTGMNRTPIHYNATMQMTTTPPAAPVAAAGSFGTFSGSSPTDLLFSAQAMSKMNITTATPPVTTGNNKNNNSPAVVNNKPGVKKELHSIVLPTAHHDHHHQYYHPVTPLSTYQSPPPAAQGNGGMTSMKTVDLLSKENHNNNHNNHHTRNAINFLNTDPVTNDISLDYDQILKQYKQNTQLFASPPPVTTPSTNEEEGETSDSIERLSFHLSSTISSKTVAGLHPKLIHSSPVMKNNNSETPSMIGVHPQNDVPQPLQAPQHPFTKKKIYDATYGSY
jgi:hypothetical protein